MDLDYEVVFEGSPLAAHMQECGVDFAVEKKEEMIQDNTGSLSRKICSLVKMIGDIWPKKPVVEYYRGMSLEAIIQSNVLEKDVLDHIIADLLFDNERYKVPTKTELVKRGICDSMLAAILSAVLYSYPLKLKTKLTLMCVPPVFLLWHWRSLFTVRREYRNLCMFLTNVHFYNDVLKKAITLISESHIVNKGYLMTKNQSQIWNLESAEISELVNMSQNFLPGLRIAVLETSTRLAVAYSIATEEQKSKAPLPYNLDHSSMYMPEFTVEDLPGGDSKVPTLPVLKASLDILYLKQLECLRRIASHLLCSQSTGRMKIIIGKHLIVELTSCIEELYMALRLHRSVIQVNKCPIKLLAKDKKVAPMNDLHNYFRSCQSHLRAAVISSNGIDECIEDWLSDSEIHLNEIQEGLGRVLHHIKSSEFCLNRTVVLMNKMNTTESSLVSQIIIPESNENVGDEITCDRPQMEDNEFPKDELFEIITNDYVKECDSYSKLEEDESPIAVDRMSTAVMMQELKNVLKSKANDWEEREKLIRQRVTGVPETHKEINLSSQPSLTDCVNNVPVNRNLREKKETMQIEATLNSTNLSASGITQMPLDSSLNISASEGEDCSNFSGKPMLMPPMAISDALAANLSNYFERHGQGHESSIFLGNLATEAVAKAHTSGLPLLEEDSYECTGGE